MRVRYAGVIPRRSALTVAEVRILQFMLVDVWSRHIARYRAGEKLQHLAGGASGGASQENGHALEARAGGKPGVRCRKCGKFVERLQHVQLKITGRPCDHAALPQNRWLREEGYNQSVPRLDRLEEELNAKYNVGRHELQWNRKTGKAIGGDDEGIITCLRCKRVWRWKDRVNNRPKVTV